MHETVGASQPAAVRERELSPSESGHSDGSDSGWEENENASQSDNSI